MPEIFDKDIGTLIRLDTEVDVSTATFVDIAAITPAGDKILLDAEIFSTTIIQHIKTDSTLAIPGIWLLQAHAVFSEDLEFYGQEVSLTVGAAIAPPV